LGTWSPISEKHALVFFSFGSITQGGWVGRRQAELELEKWNSMTRWSPTTTVDLRCAHSIINIIAQCR
jgi:hypothetical protein